MTAVMIARDFLGPSVPVAARNTAKHGVSDIEEEFPEIRN
jgi:hypothetical protein